MQASISLPSRLSGRVQPCGQSVQGLMGAPVCIVLHPACVRNERTTDLDETRDVVLQDVVKPVGSRHAVAEDDGNLDLGRTSP